MGRSYLKIHHTKVPFSSRSQSAETVYQLCSMEIDMRLELTINPLSILWIKKTLQAISNLTSIIKLQIKVPVISKADLEEAINREDNSRISMKMLKFRGLLSYQKRPPRMKIKKGRKLLNMRRKKILILGRISNSLRHTIKVPLLVMISTILILELW